MSLYYPNSDKTPVFAAVAHWRDDALKNSGSVFSKESIWDGANIASLKWHFVDHPDEGEGTFQQKLERQLAPAVPMVKRLAAEMTWFMLLCPRNVGIENKRDTISTIWGWSGAQLSMQSPWLTDEVLQGLGSAGTAFNTWRWRELRFFILVTESYRSLGKDQQQEILNDGWRFAEWISGIPEADSRQLRHMILHLLFPSDFERIFGRSDRRKILRIFTSLSVAQIAALSPLAVDQELRTVRADQEKKFHTPDLDFYVTPLKEIWKPQDVADTSAVTEPTAEGSLDAKQLTRANVLHALEQIRGEGIPDGAISTTYDLIEGVYRYPPQLVFSLAIKRATGRDVSRTEIGAGDASACFKSLRELGFFIERKNLIAELVQRFLKQADEGTSLSAQGYPTAYRGLKVNVSFGKGTVARIPWVSFTGFEQTIGEGIYPVLLYYRSQARLVVAYGISETKTPHVRWRLPTGAVTIAEALSREHLAAAERYGSSFVRALFNVSEQVDFAGIENSLDETIASYREQFANEQPLSGRSAKLAIADSPQPYTVEEALQGLFMEEQEFKRMLSLARSKKNILLQGAPGVGKTYIARRLAYALMGEKASHRFQMVQFHQSYSYEDFIQGYRPSGNGFRLKNGIFYEFCQSARNDPSNAYVFAIDEINRGNLSKVLGEVMMLIESDKRGPEWGIPLAYSESAAELFYVPANVYLIGLMNTADRSLAMVDYALRRRFGFYELVPAFDTEEFRQFLEERGGEQTFIEMLIARLTTLNSLIEGDVANLGSGYRIGHSYFCSVAHGLTPDWAWYCEIIRSEIAPLLREYYFDNAKRAATLVEELLRPA